MAKSKLYYLQNVSAGYCGNSIMFWREGGSGYTPRLNEAQKFSGEEANEIIAGTRSSHEWKKWSVEKLDKIAHTAIDMQDLRRVK